MVFQPAVNQELVIDDVTYRVAAHPAALGLPYGQEGRQATVYQLVAAAERRALKVFKPRFRVPALAGLARRLAAFAGLPGLAVCRRTVLIPQHATDLLRQYPELTYAVLMPWIAGPTWMEVVVGAQVLAPDQSLAVARALASVLAGMEQEGLAHCDLSGPNVLLPALAEAAARGVPSAIALVDVEQLYGPDLSRPVLVPSGSPGYAHRTAAEGLWTPEADRFAGAVLLAEMLGWCDERVRVAAWGESYFDPAELQQPGARLETLRGVLAERWGGDLARLLERAWQSETLADCPTFGEWLISMPAQGPAPGAPPPAGASGWRVAAGAPVGVAGVGPAAVEATTVIPGTDRGAPAPAAGAPVDDLAGLFGAGLLASRREDWANARELLAEVVRQQPEYMRQGQRARLLLAAAEQHLAPVPRARGLGRRVVVAVVGLIGLLVAGVVLMPALVGRGVATPTPVPGPTDTVAAVAPTDSAPPPSSGAGVAARNTAPPLTSTAAPATNTPFPMPATGADIDLISQAVTATKNLKSYHALVVASGRVFTQALNLEGDFVAPDGAYLKGTAGGQKIEELTTGGKTYIKNAGGQWVVQANTGSGGGSGSPVDLTGNANFVDSLAPLLAAGAGYVDVGQNTMDGASVRHFTGKIDAGSLMGAAAGGALPAGSGVNSLNLGTVDLWIDPSTKYIHKVSMALDLGPLMAMLGQMAAAFGGTAGPGTPTATPLPATMTANISVTLSKINDPSIAIPAAPANAVAAPTSTAAPALATSVPSADTPTTGAGGAAATDTPASGAAAPTTAAAGPMLKLGDSATLGGWKVTAKSLKEVPGITGFTPGDGMRFVAVDVTVENTTAKDSPLSATLSMQLRDGTGKFYSPGISAQLATGAKAMEGNVPANGNLSGLVAFEVPKDAKGFQWGFKDFVTDANATWDLGQ